MRNVTLNSVYSIIVLIFISATISFIFIALHQKHDTRTQGTLPRYYRFRNLPLARHEMHLNHSNILNIFSWNRMSDKLNISSNSISSQYSDLEQEYDKGITRISSGSISAAEQDFNVLIGAIVERSHECSNPFQLVAYFQLPHNYRSPIHMLTNLPIVCKVTEFTDAKAYYISASVFPLYEKDKANSTDTLIAIRCAMRMTEISFRQLHEKISDDHILVDIVYDYAFLHSFSVPWSTRRTGFMLTLPTDVSRFDVWRGLVPPEGEEKRVDHKSHHRLYICATGVEYPPDVYFLPLYLEFVQHHLLLGADHIFLGASFGWESPHMRRLLQVFRSYIDEGKLSIISVFDEAYSSKAMNDILFSHTCRTVAQGMSSYLATWSVVNFFIPKLPLANLIEVCAQLTEQRSWIPLTVALRCPQGTHKCTVPFMPIAVQPLQKSRYTFVDDKPWIGDKFRYVPMELIEKDLATFDNGHHLVTGIYLLQPDNYPSDTHNGSTTKELLRFKSGLVASSDLGWVYKLSLFETEVPRTGIFTDYYSRFYKSVEREIHKRDLDVLVLLPERSSRNSPDTSGWIKYQDFYHGIYQDESKLGQENGADEVLLPGQKDLRVSGLSTLPTIASDYSDVAIGSIIEREFDSHELTLTTFFVCHALLLPEYTHMGPRMVHADVTQMWRHAIKKFKETKYNARGQRNNVYKTYCKISNAFGESSYIVEGLFLPNILTPDKSTNRRLDVLRCRMRGSPQQYYKLAHSSESVQVEIIQQNISLFRFSVPWSTRRTGFMLTLPTDVSRFDAWRGLVPPEGEEKRADHKSHHRLYICTPGIESPPSRIMLPLYLEFVQHHLLLGADHIFLGASFGWESPHMRRLLQVFRSYIDEGKLSIASQTDHGIDNMHSFQGIYWERNVVKLIHINSYLYLAKGMADYVGVWDLDEFFIPRKPYNDMLEVLRVLEGPPIQSSGGRKAPRHGDPGMADGDDHPFCYLSLNSRVILKGSDKFDYDHLWLGERFPHGYEGPETKFGKKMGFKKAFLPTRTVFQAGLHMSGACKLPSPFNGCSSHKEGKLKLKKVNDFCFSQDPDTDQGVYSPFNHHATDITSVHRFDDVVFDKDYKRVDPESIGVIYHFYSTFRYYLTTAERPLSEESKRHTNEYTARFFLRVMHHLRLRDLEKFIGLPFNESYLLSVAPEWDTITLPMSP